MTHLRGYQIEAIDAAMAALSTRRGTILDMATGTGKTVCIAEIIRRFQPKKGIILAHRRELVRQAKDKVESFADLIVAVEMAGERASRTLFANYEVVVSSVQSQTPGRRFDPMDFGLLVIDEFHHGKPKNKSYMDVINHYLEGNPDLKILGVTATLEAPCLKVIDHVAYSYPILTGIREGYLVEPKQLSVTIQDLDYSHIDTTAGDLNAGQLSAVLEAENVSQGMIQATLECMFSVPQHSLTDKPVEEWAPFLLQNKPKRNLVFTISVAQAKTMADIFNRVMPGKWAWVCGDKNLISEELREEIGRKFQTGELLGVCNCGIYSEGYDNVFIDMVTMARPTKSLTLFKQQIGRGTRVLPGVIDGVLDKDYRIECILASAKPDLTVLDFVGNAGRHRLCSVMDIVSEGESEEVKARAKKKNESSGQADSFSELLRKSAEEIEEEKKARAAAEAARKARVVAKANYSMSSVDLFTKYDLKPKKANAWDERYPLSPKQLAVLKDAGVDMTGMSMTHKKQLFQVIIKAPSTKQQACLRRAGYDPMKYDRKQAGVIMDALIRNGWSKTKADAELAGPTAPPPQETVIQKTASVPEPRLL